MLHAIGLKISNKLILWHVLKLGQTVTVGVSVLVLALYLPPAPVHTSVQAKKIVSKQSSSRQVSPSKAVQPAATAPPAPAPQTAPPPAQTPKKASVPTGTPKAEPAVTPSPSSNVSGLTPTTPPPAPPAAGGSPAPSPQTVIGYTSTNWSGYLATNGTFTAVYGSWTATLATGNGTTTSADSTWIGIGGVTSGDLIQIGTQNIIAANGQISTSAFYEMLPAVSQPVPGVNVSPGDSMTASIIETGSGQWTISITDTTNGQAYTATVAYASSLSSAEWIEEDPSYSFRRQIPFDNFHQASFSGGSTVAAGVRLTIAASTAQPVTMVDDNGQPIAVPSAIGADGASFTVAP